MIMYSGLVSASLFSVYSQVPPVMYEADFSKDPVGWSSFGDASLFKWDAQEGQLMVHWDSSRTNSYFYLPLGLNLNRSDDFSLSFTLQLNDIAIGTTAGKQYTFQVALGLVNMANATDPQMFRGTGIDAAHGAKNAIEFDYFPDSGFGASVSPTLITEKNEIAFGGAFPLELTVGIPYKVHMAFDAASQSLTSSMLKDGQPFPPEGLKSAVLSAASANFKLDAIAIASYSDAGQTPEYAGSISSHGIIDDIELTVLHRARLDVSKTGLRTILLQFPTETGWSYFIESTGDFRTWERKSQEIAGGVNQRMELPNSEAAEFFRLVALRKG